MTDAQIELIKLAQRVVDILDVKARKGCTGENKAWYGFNNGNGTEIGFDIEALIRKAKRTLKKYVKPKERKEYFTAKELRQLFKHCCPMPNFVFRNDFVFKQHKRVKVGDSVFIDGFGEMQVFGFFKNKSIYFIYGDVGGSPRGWCTAKGII